MNPNETVLVRARRQHLEHWTGPVLVQWLEGTWERGICGDAFDKGETCIWSPDAGDWWGLAAFFSGGRKGTVYLDLGFPECMSRVEHIFAQSLGLNPEKGVIWSRHSASVWSLRCHAPSGVSAGPPPLDSYERRFTSKISSGERMFSGRRGMEKLYNEVPALAEAQSDQEALALCVGCPDA